MILLDANLLIYAKVKGFPQHKPARKWLDRKLGGTTGVGLPWPSLLAFVRIVSNPRVFERPLSVAAAWEQVESWLGLPTTWTPEPTERHQGIMEALILDASKAELIPDVHLAALAMEYGLVLQTTDRDFARFRGLRWENPLSP
jgi:toxin-antitoxin system PIN domain toxin